MAETRKNPKEIMRAIIETLNTNPQTVKSIASSIGSNWKTVWSYLELFYWVQQCPKIHRVKVTESIEAWKREWGKIPIG